MPHEDDDCPVLPADRGRTPAFAQDISVARPKNESPYKTKADAEKHKADMQQVSVCSSRVRQSKIKEGTPEWSKMMSGACAKTT
jgi:hypothetical protein